MEVGIVGLPFVGKTMLFQALTGVEPDPGAGNRPNVGVAKIPDPRLDILASHISTRKIVPAELKVLDIAGLVRGSSEGAGMGNAFLSHIRDVDAIIHVVRCFEDDGVVHVDGSVDPLRDIETIELELVLADLQMVENAIPRAEKAARRRDAESLARLSVLQKAKPILEEGIPVRTLDTQDAEEQKALRGLAMLSGKPVLYVANVGEGETGSDHANAVRTFASEHGAQCVALCAKLEAELAELAPEDRAEMLESLDLDEPALGHVARAAYDLLGLQSFYTAGEKETRAWTIHKGATAPQAAGAIHSDFERGFIRVEVYGVSDLEQYRTEKAIKEAGKMRVEGKAYVMRDADVCHFLFNV
ncbi:MAG: redox-regulated ATPase YchF [Phycisphaerales bacterium]|nr:redox-regulated ATPase YchF [Phycisphaerales bacterium]